MNNRNSKLEQLEGLRGFAAFVVLLGHLRMTFFLDAHDSIGSRLPPWLATCAEAFFDGDFAVWLFWVMSAFVLSLRYHATSDRAHATSMLTDATIRRYPRLLLPVLASIAFAWTLHSLGLMSNVKLSNLLGQEYANWLGSFYLFEPNAIAAVKSGVWQTFFAYNRDTSYNPALWTMEIELYGSFFLFSFLSLVGKHPARLLIYGATALVVYRLSLHWINAFVLGALICDGVIHKELIRDRMPPFIATLYRFTVHSRWIALLLSIPTLYLIGLPNRAGLLHLVLASVVTAYVAVSSPTGRLFSSRILVFLGKISFGLYLAHLPLICAAAFPVYIAFAEYNSPGAASAYSAIVIAFASILAGWCLWYVSDRPAIAFSRMVANLLRDGITKR